MQLKLDKSVLHLHKQISGRFVELDMLRGLAIFLMIFLHVLWDLDYFGLFPLDRELYQYSRIVPILFLLLVGTCLVVSANRKDHKSIQDRWIYEKHLMMRGLKIFSLGMVLTSISMIVLPGRPVLFGVLHCIGLSIVLSVPFLRLKHKIYNVLFGVLAILTGFVVYSYVVNYPTFFHLMVGFHQSEVWRYTVDYFPLFPWFGVCLLGIALGDWLYKDNKRRFRLPDLAKYKPVTLFSWIGQHSLAIYLIHQPIIAGLLSVYLII